MLQLLVVECTTTTMASPSPSPAVLPTTAGSRPTPNADARPAPNVNVRPAPKVRKTLKMEIYMGGYLFTSKEQIGTLCKEAYGYTQSRLDIVGPFDAATLHFELHSACDSPNLYPVGYYIHGDRTHVKQGWLLPCRVVLVPAGSPRPDVSLNEAAEKYAEHWFPSRVRELPGLKGRVPYAQRIFRRGLVRTCRSLACLCARSPSLH